MTSIATTQNHASQSPPKVVSVDKINLYRDAQNSIEQGLGNPEKRAGLGRFVHITPTDVVKMYSPRAATWALDNHFIQNSALMIQNVALASEEIDLAPKLKQLIFYKENDSITRLTAVFENGGKDLEVFLADRCYEALPTEIVQDIGHQIITKLNYLHAKKIVHRDVKPENILFHLNKIRFIDFDFSTIINRELPILGPGTAAYIAPEILLKPVERDQLPKTDIFSAGIVLLLLATGDTLISQPSFTSSEEQSEPEEIDFYTQMIQQDKLNDIQIRPSLYIHLYAIQETLGAFPETYQEALAKLGCWANGAIPCFLNETTNATWIKEHLCPLEERVKNPDLLDLLKRMLALDPRQRPTAAEVLKSPFFESSLKLHDEDLEEAGNGPAAKPSSSVPPLPLQEVLQKQADAENTLYTPNVPKNVFPTAYPSNGAQVNNSSALDLDTPTSKAKNDSSSSSE